MPKILHISDLHFGPPYLPELGEAMLETIGRLHVAKLGKLVEDVESIVSQPITCYRDFVSAVFASHAIKKGKARWGDKTPGYIDHIELLATLFPDSQIIHVIRNKSIILF